MNNASDNSFNSRLHLVRQSRGESPGALTSPVSAARRDSDQETEEPKTLESAEELELVRRARNREPAAFELLMRRNNQRLYRVIRAIIRDATEVEDVMQQAYLQAFTHLEQFSGASRWSTWLCRIAINEAKARCRQRARVVPTDMTVEEAQVPDVSKTNPMSPEYALWRRELGHVVEQAIDGLPEIYRCVLMMREVEGMSTNESATVLSVEPDVVKTRLHRARTALRSAIEEQMGEGIKHVYEFGNERCDRVVAAVLATLSRGA
jgi:RNA polymerase sigma-70 factor (ECF subfamily)